MKKLLPLVTMIGLVVFVGCGGSEDTPVALPTPTGSGFLTGKWTGTLENYHFYRWDEKHWIINHEGDKIDIISYQINDDGTYGVSSYVLSGTIHHFTYDQLWVEGTNSPPIFLKISPDRNTLYNDFQGNGGQLDRVVE